MQSIYEAYSKVKSNFYHSKLDERGNTVYIHAPTKDKNLDGLSDASKHVVIPDKTEVTSMESWKAPSTIDDWNNVDGQGNFDEPEMKSIAGKRFASGAIIHEDDGRIWLVHPTNEFGGYKATFPKGKVDSGLNPRANAIKEAYEESGLKIQLLAHAADVERSTSHTRYYHAKRVGGNPQDMGWESQAVSLVPKDQLASVCNHPNDAVLVKKAVEFKGK
jgi:ADP-ribose pyrophosphatase YjhB (NUDIX family)